MLITEMSFPLSEYRRKADNKIPQIVTNWCLVRYASKNERYKRLKSHWCSELLAHMTYVGGLRTKKGNDTESKMKVLYGLWAAYEIDRDEKAVDMMVSAKFVSEKIDTYSQEYIDTLSECVAATKDIVNALLSESRAAIFNYIKTL